MAFHSEQHHQHRLLLNQHWRMFVLSLSLDRHETASLVTTDWWPRWYSAHRCGVSFAAVYLHLMSKEHHQWPVLLIVSQRRFIHGSVTIYYLYSSSEPSFRIEISPSPVKILCAYLLCSRDCIFSYLSKNIGSYTNTFSVSQIIAGHFSDFLVVKKWWKMG